MANRTDTFNRADSTTELGTPSDAGSDWVALTGTWGISSNQGYCLTSSGENVAYLETSEADGTIEVTIAATATEMGVAARIADISNYLVLAIAASSATLYKCVAGSYTQLGSTYSHSFTASDVVQFITSGSSLTIKVNGTTAITATDAAGSANTKHGLRTFGSASGNRFDAFSFVGSGGGGSSPPKRSLLLGVG